MACIPEALMVGSDWQQIGPYRGQVFDAARHPGLADALAGLGTRLSTGHCERLQGGRHQTFRLALTCGDGTIDVVAKRFGRQSALKDRWDALHGSEAARTFRAASYLTRHGIGTTPPLAVLERWEGRRLAESYFVSRFLAETVSFKDLLLSAFGDGTGAAPLDALLGHVAVAVRRMHDAGCRHNDLGNQNILLCGSSPDAPAGRAVAFVDLNRARCGRPPSGWGRARDLSRVTLPSGLLARFLDHYWQDATPHWFGLLEALHRYIFALHTMTRVLRHPLREMRYRRQAGMGDVPQHAVYPSCRDYWIWDAAAEEPLAAIAPWEVRLRTPLLRSACRLGVHAADVLRGVLRGGASARNGDTPRLPGSEAVIAVGGTEALFRQTSQFVRELAPRQVCMRFYMHEEEAALQERMAVAQKWVREGYALAAGLVQCRTAVREPERWAAFCERVVAALAPHLEWVMVGHAVDEVKWGVWGYGEYRRMMAPLAAVAGRHPYVVWAGPSVALARLNDVAAALRQWLPGLPCGAVAVRLPRDAGRFAAGRLRSQIERVRTLARVLPPYRADRSVVLAARCASPETFDWISDAMTSRLASRVVIETDLTDGKTNRALRAVWARLSAAGQECRQT